MKKLILGLFVFAGAVSLACAGTEYTGKEMRQTAVQQECWYGDTEWNVSLWGTYAFAGTDQGHIGAPGFFLRDDNTPRTEHLRSLFWEALHSALAELPEEQRQVFVWHELESLSFQDIAALTGENLNTLLSRKRYAILHLRLRLEPLRAELFSVTP